MKKLMLVMLTLVLGGLAAMTAANPDMIVMQNGESIHVYNLDDAGTCYYYTLTDDNDSAIKKIAKTDVLIIKKADGSKIDPLEKSSEAATSSNNPKAIKNPDEHPSTTIDAIEPDFVKIHMKKARQITIYYRPTLPERDEYYISGLDKNGHKLSFRRLSEEEKALAVTNLLEITEKSGKLSKDDKKYEQDRYDIPEYVRVGNEVYTVTEIDPEAFCGCKKIHDIVFPNTLKKIGCAAFAGMSIFSRIKLSRIVLPEGLEEIGAYAFYLSGGDPFEQLYIPKSVKTIGEDAFRYAGPKTSYKGYTQCNVTSLPDFITVGNCTSYGIDEEAVEDYQKRLMLK